MHTVYFAAVLGPRLSGKSTLAQACARHNRHNTVVSTSPTSPRRATTRPFASLLARGADSLQVLDPLRHSDETSLGRALARRMPVAALLTLPRDTVSASQAQAATLQWANLARAHADRVRLALVVTKCDVSRPPLDDVSFERAALDAMRVSGVEQLFYTEALRRGADGVRDWILDVLSERQDEDKTVDARSSRSRYTVCLEPPRLGVLAGVPQPSGLEIAHAGSQQRTCDQCALS